MITLNYQTYGNSGFQLRLRLYQAGETRFIAVNKMLKGSLQKRHWNQKKQAFIPSAPFSEENNRFLNQFRDRYARAAADWQGSLYGLVLSLEAKGDSPAQSITLQNFIDSIIEELMERKHPDGTIKGTFEEYKKCKKRIEEFCIYKHWEFSNIIVSEITPPFVVSLFEWLEKSRGGKGLRGTGRILHAIMARAEKLDLLNMDDFKRCKWPEKKKGSEYKYETLTEDQVREFSEMDFAGEKNPALNRLYRDVCLFMLYTGQSLCDALSLRYNDMKKIDGVVHFVFKRRKIAHKQAIPCAVPVSAEMLKILERWHPLCKDGYVFPVRSKQKLQTQITNNGDIKHFLGRLNHWLKSIGAKLRCEFSLHTYTFRHTAITRYIQRGIPAVYVANMMGTSVDNIEKIYYNNQGDSSSRDKVLRAMVL